MTQENRTIGDLRTELSTANSTSNTLQEQVQLSESELALLRAQVAGFPQQKMDAVAEAVPSKDVEIEWLTKQVELLTQEKEALTTEMNSLIQDKAQLEQEKQALNQKIETLGAEKQSLEAEKKSLVKEKDDLEQDAESLREANTNLEQLKNSVEGEKQSWEDRSGTNFTRYTTEKTRADGLQTALNTANSQLSNLKLSHTSKIEELKSSALTDLSNANTELEDLKLTHTNEIEKLNSSASKEAAELKTENSKEKATLRDSEQREKRDLGNSQKMVVQEQEHVRDIKSAVQAFLNQSDNDQDFVADMTRLHKTAQGLLPSLIVYNIPNIRTSLELVHQPEYSTAFELWLQARKGIMDAASATAFVVQEEFPQGQEKFLPCIHAAVCCLTPVLVARLSISGVSNFELLRDLVLVMQLLAYVHLVSQTIEEKPEWTPSLLHLLDQLSSSIPDSTSIIFKDMESRLRSLLADNMPFVSWLDLTASKFQLNATNSLLEAGTHLVLDSAADTLVLITGKPQYIQLLRHEDIESLEEINRFTVVLTMRVPQPNSTFQIENPEHLLSTQSWAAISWKGHSFFDIHRKILPAPIQ